MVLRSLLTGSRTPSRSRKQKFTSFAHSSLYLPFALVTRDSHRRLVGFFNRRRERTQEAEVATRKGQTK